MAYKEDLVALIDILIAEGASDLHLSANNHPIIRVNGSLIPLLKKPVYSAEDISGFVAELLTPEQNQVFTTKKEFDFSYSHQDKVRFRGNVYIQSGKPSIALRLIPYEIKTMAELNLPEVLETFAQRKQGFFLVVGPVGQGKSTTLAAMLDYINKTRAEHIVTIEDPIEYVFTEDKSFIDQREVRIDTDSFATALKSVFRQDINVLMLGEMRDPETISTAVTAAETGHLVFSTLHTNDAAQTIDRIIDSFQPGQQEQIRLQLASSLAGIFSQRLIPRVSGGRVPAYELLVSNNAVSNLIREKRTHEINTVIETGAEEGMVDMNRSLADLVRRGEITIENALSRSLNPRALEGLV